MSSKSNTSEPIITKSISDVLCGRGGLSNNHPGNHVFRRIVNQNKEFYQACENPSHKHFVVISIISAIRKNGGRFIELKSGVWQEIPVKKAMTKTSQALREQESTATTTAGTASTSSTSTSKSGSKSKSSIAIAKSKKAAPKNSLSSAPPTITLTKPSNNVRRVSEDGSTTSSTIRSTKPAEPEPEISSCSTVKPVKPQAMDSKTTIPETIPSHKMNTQPPQESYYHQSFFSSPSQQKEEQYSANVIECEIEQALEDLLDDDDFTMQKEQLECTRLSVAQSPFPYGFQQQDKAATMILCSDSEEEGDEDYDQQSYGLDLFCPLGISESNLFTHPFEYAEMCNELVTSLSSC